MGRKKDLEREALIQKLGVSTTKHWTKEELLAMEKKQAEREAKVSEQTALTAIIAGEVPDVPPAELEIPFDLRGKADPLGGLSDRQKNIARLRMRGMSQQAIANIVGVSQPIISQELKVIKDWQAERGSKIDQSAIVGNTATLYEEVEQMAWQMYYTSGNTVADKAKCLSVVMQAREKHNNLLMDLGLLKKASQEITHTMKVNPFIQNWKDSHEKKAYADSIVAGQLKALPEPSPDEDIIDADLADPVVPVQDVEVILPTKTDLAEPTPDEDLEIDTE